MFKVKLSKFYIVEINPDKQSLLAKLGGVKEEIWNWPHQISHVPSFFVTTYRTKVFEKSSNITWLTCNKYCRYLKWSYIYGFIYSHLYKPLHQRTLKLMFKSLKYKWPPCWNSRILSVIDKQFFASLFNWAQSL